MHQFTFQLSLTHPRGPPCGQNWWSSRRKKDIATRQIAVQSHNQLLPNPPVEVSQKIAGVNEKFGGRHKCASHHEQQGHLGQEDQGPGGSKGLPLSMTIQLPPCPAPNLRYCMVQTFSPFPINFSKLTSGPHPHQVCPEILVPPLVLPCESKLKSTSHPP